MRFWALSIVLASFCVVAVPQEVKHLPTLESCASDLNLWSSEISGWPNPSVEQGRRGTKRLTFAVIGARASSIGDCIGAYPILNRARPNELPAPASLLNIYLQETTQRYLNFIDRHDFWLSSCKKMRRGSVDERTRDRRPCPPRFSGLRSSSRIRETVASDTLSRIAIRAIVQTIAAKLKNLRATISV
jgi:hypothetical protein